MKHEKLSIKTPIYIDHEGEMYTADHVWIDGHAIKDAVNEHDAMVDEIADLSRPVMTGEELYARCGKCGECAYCRAVRDHLFTLRKLNRFAEELAAAKDALKKVYDHFGITWVDSEQGFEYKPSYVTRLDKHYLDGELAATNEEIGRMREALEIYKYVCANCGKSIQDHDEHGLIDMVCDNPKYPVAEALAGKE